MFFKALLLVAVFSGFGNTEEIDVRMCPNAECNVRQVNIDSCFNYTRNRPCQLRRGTNATITFQLEPDFYAGKPLSRLVARFPNRDVPMFDTELNGCLHTQCPLVPHVEQIFHHSFFIDSTYALMAYPMQMVIVNFSADECCFDFDLEIVN